MAAVTVVAELKLRDGQKQKICVQVENNLSSLVHGIKDLNVRVSKLLSGLIEQDTTHEGEGDEEDGSDEEEEPEDPQNSELQPPAKRSKT